MTEEMWKCEGCDTPIGYIGRLLQWLHMPFHRCVRGYPDLAACALDVIHELLDNGGIPRGTFADDHVRNLVVLYNLRGDEIERLRTLRQAATLVAEGGAVEIGSTPLRLKMLRDALAALPELQSEE